MLQMENLNNYTKNILKGKEDLQFSKVNNLMKDSFEFQIKAILELFDKELSNQVSRDKRHIKQYRDDSINLGYIKVRFKKTQFEWNPKSELKIGKKYFCPMDKYLNITNSEEHNLKLLLGIVEEVIKTRSYRNLASKMDGIYPKWISKMLKKLKFEYKIKQLRTKTETLFVCLDGQWFNTHKNTGRSKEMKFGVCWTGVKKIYNKAVLQERTVVSMQNTKNTNEIAYKVLDIVEKVYGDIKEIKIIGDGATWITSVARIINNFIPTTRYIDKYHYKDYLYRFWGKNKSKCFQDTSFLHSWDWKEIEKYILKIKFANITKDGEIIYKDKNEHSELFKALTKVERSNFYKLKKFNEKYKQNINYGKTINPIEGIQSNYFAKFFRGRRAFNLDNLIKLLELQMCYLNDWKVSLSRDNYSWMKLNISEYQSWNEFDLPNDDRFRPDPPKEVGLKMSGLKSNVILEN